MSGQLNEYKFKNNYLVCMLAANESGRRFCIFGFASKYMALHITNMALPIKIWFCP